MLMLHRKYF